MKLPKLHEPQRYKGLYVVAFKDHVSVGFTAEEVAELLESERYAKCKVYKIHRAAPDGGLELKGVPRGTFQLEAGLLFHAAGDNEACENYSRLIGLAGASRLPCRAKIHLARLRGDDFVVAFIYPAEYDDEISRWLLDSGYDTAGAVEGGTAAVSRYYSQCGQILRKRQFHAPRKDHVRSGTGLMDAVRLVVQR